MSDEKKSKLGEKEAQVRALREARVAKNKKVIDKNVKELNKAFNVKGEPHQSKTRKKSKVVQFKGAKRGRTGR